MTAGRIVLGRITAPFGVRGWVKVDSFTDPPEALFERETWAIGRPDAASVPRNVRPVEARPQGQRFCVRLEGIDDRDAAAAVAGTEISVERAELPPTAPAEYYQADLVGFTVKTVDGEELGKLSHFAEAPSGAMMVIKGVRERLLPAFPPFLRRVDLAAGELFVDWPADL